MEKRILFITPQLPYPPISGGVIKSWNLVKFLSEKHHLTLACLLKNDDAKNEKQFLKKIKLDNFTSHQINVPRSISSFIKSIVHGICLNVYRNRSKIFKEKILSLSKDYDIIFIDHYEVFQYVPKSFGGKIVFHQHNAEHVIWNRFAQTLPFPKSWIIQKEAKRVLKSELEYCQKSHLILAAPNDIKALIKQGANGEKFKETFHLGEDFMLNLPPLNFVDTEPHLLYIGTLSWEANVQGLLWFFNQCWPSIKSQSPATKIYVIGKNPDKRLVEIATKDNNIILAGFVENLDVYYQKCRVSIAPLQFGSGIKVKVLNSMYRGLPMVTTPIGAEGLKVQNGRHLSIANDANEFSKQTIELLQNQAKWNELSNESRVIALELYTWDKHLQEINSYL